MMSPIVFNAVSNDVIQPHRRRLMAALGASLLLPATRWAQAAAAPARTLTFDHLHTGEKLTVEYFAGGRYLPDALGEVNHLLRDFRTGDVGTMDPALLDLLFALSGTVGSRRPFQIISGYRSPKTNQMLREHGGGGVARKSLHMEGQAVDIRLPGVALPALRDAAVALGSGGVGFYPKDDFVHVDTGRVRRW